MVENRDFFIPPVGATAALGRRGLERGLTVDLRGDVIYSWRRLIGGAARRTCTDMSNDMERERERDVCVCVCVCVLVCVCVCEREF